MDLEATVEIEREGWCGMFKRRDHVLAGATLALDDGADYITGCDEPAKALAAIRNRRHGLQAPGVIGTLYRALRRWCREVASPK
jgi:hypothetical protein